MSQQEEQEDTNETLPTEGSDNDSRSTYSEATSGNQAPEALGEGTRSPPFWADANHRTELTSLGYNVHTPNPRRTTRSRAPTIRYTPSGDTNQEEADIENNLLNIQVEVNTAREEDESTASAYSGLRPGDPLYVSPPRLPLPDSSSTDTSSVPERPSPPEPIEEVIDTSFTLGTFPTVHDPYVKGYEITARNPVPINVPLPSLPETPPLPSLPELPLTERLDTLLTEICNFRVRNLTTRRAFATNITPSNTSSPKMATTPFDAQLEVLLVNMLKCTTATNPIYLVLDQNHIHTFEQFRSIEIDDLPTFKYKKPTTAGTEETLHITPLKEVQNCVHFCCYLETAAAVALAGGVIDCDDPSTWDYADMLNWKRAITGKATYLRTLVIPVTTTTGAPGSPTMIVSGPITLKDDEAALISWNRKPRDPVKYPTINNDAFYQDWKLNFKRQIIQDTLERVLDPNFNPDLRSSTCSVRSGPDAELARLQVNYFAQILCVVLKNPEGLGLLMVRPDDPLYVWRNHEDHQNDSDAAQIASTTLMKKLIALKFSDFNTRHEFLTSFQDTSRRYDQLATNVMDDSVKITLLQTAVMTDSALINSWQSCQDSKRGSALAGSSRPVTYYEYITFLIKSAKNHDLYTPYKKPSRQAHQATSESFYDEEMNVDYGDTDDGIDEFLAHMSVSNEPMTEHAESTMQAYAAFQKNRRPPRERDPDTEIPKPIFEKCPRDLRIAWSKAPNDIKKQILKIKNHPTKQGAKKNSELGVYISDFEGYDSDASGQSEHTYVYDADDADDTSVIEATDLTANAARRRQPNQGILKKKELPRKTELPLADPRRFMANKTTPVIGKDGKVVGHIAYTAAMAKINHRFDQVDCHLPNTSKDNYVVSVNATKFFNEPLALMDGGANGGIGGRDMRLMSYNADGRRVNIGIAGDHQMTGKRLGTFCSVIVTNRGKILAIFHQYAHVPEQEKSIHSKCQFQAHNNLVGDTATAYGGPQRIQTADGYQLPLSIRSGLPYIRQTYPTNDEIKELTHVQFTSPAEWNPNLNDDSRTPEEMLKQFPPMPRSAINEFYDQEGNINYDYLSKQEHRPIRATVQTVEIEHDDDDSVGSMPGLQCRAQEEDSSGDEEDSSSDDEPVVNKFKQPTTIVWNDPIDDSNGEKIECPRLRKSKLKRRIRIKEKRLKAAASKQELIDKKPSAVTANDLPIPIIDNMVNDNESPTMVDGIEFFSTDPHPLQPNIIDDVIEEMKMDDLLFYDSVDKPQDSTVFVDTISDTSYLDDLSTFRPTEHEYWEDFLMDESTQRLIYQGRLDYYEQYDINATDIANVMNPLTPRYSVPTVIDYESKRKYFAHLPASVVKATFKHTTQNMKLPPASYLHKMFKSPNPSANLKRRDEDDATDMIYSDTPACNGGEKCAHIFVGRKSKLTDAYKVKHQNAEDFLLCFQDRVRQRGCPTGLVADNAPMYRGWKNAVYLRDICISLWQCESKYQHQNYAENRWQTVKRYTNRVMDRSGCPPYVWFLALSYVIFCLNNCVDPTIGEGNKSPLQIATFQMTDISPLLYFYFWEPVYYLVDESEQHFPSKSKEMRGRWVGISEHIGNKMTYKIISDTTGNEICRSAIRTARDNTMKNLREDPVTVDKDLFNVENILSPAEDIANNKLKEVTSGNTFNDFDESAISKDIEIQLQAELDARFNDSNEQQTGHFKTASPKRASPTGPQRHVKQKRLSDLNPLDKTKDKGLRRSSRHKPLQNLNVKGVTTLLTQVNNTDINHPTNPQPSTATRQQVLKQRDTSIKEQLDSFVYLRENGENEYLLGKEFEFPLKDENGNAILGDDGKPLVAIAPPPSDLVGRVFLTKPDERGEVNRARVVELIKDFEGKVEKDMNLIKFKLNYDHSSQEDIMSYNEILDYIEREQNNEDGHHWKFRTILGHVHTPVGHKDRMGSDYNVRTAWETGAISVEPLDFLAKDIPVDLAIYAKKFDLLELEGWKRFKRIANRDKHIRRLVKQAKLRSFRVTPKYKYGFSIPRNYKEALEFDERNGNHKWQEANVLEHAQLTDYAVFKNKGEFHDAKIPEGYRKIKVHTIFDVKHDGRHKARVVANGNLTDTPLESVYSGVVSLRGLRTCIFLGELNGMTPWATDIGNAYLEAKTTEKVCIKAGPEFGELQGNLLIIDKALYGLRLSGKAFNILLSDCLRDLGFYPSKAESSIFMRKCPTRDVYEYVATYVDDLCIVMENPREFLNQLSSAPYNFKLKGSGEVNFHLGCGFERDSDGVLCMDPSRYIDKMEDAYKQYFKELPNQKHRSPLVKGDHPELDVTEFLDQDGIEIYQSLIGAMQWAISIGRWDIQSAVMSLSSFRAQPRKGHLERIKRIYGFLCKFRHFKLRFRVDEPDYSGIPPMPPYDWSHSVYGNPTEDIPKDAPTPLGKRIVLTHYFDANLMHDVLSGKAVTGVVHFYNKTPVDWYSKKQSTTETATYGSEFLACRTCFEQIIDHRQYLRYLGVPVGDEDYAWGDNDAMINSATIPDAKLHKRHNILSFHFVRSLIASGFINLQHIKSESNIADILTKHWGYQSTYELIRPIFHFGGNTAALYFDDTLEVDRHITESELAEIVTTNGEC